MADKKKILFFGAGVIGGRRLIAGFFAAGGSLENDIVMYQMPHGLQRFAQATTFGELDGSISPRLKEIVNVIRDAGFRSLPSRNMDAWLKTHIAVVSPIANAMYKCSGSNYELAKSKDVVREMIEAIREGFTVIKALGHPVTPGKLNFFRIMPISALVIIFSRILKTVMAETYMAKHANAARDEMKQLADEFCSLRDRAGVKTPAIDELCRYM